MIIMHFVLMVIPATIQQFANKTSIKPFLKEQTFLFLQINKFAIQ
ncbi:MAG: hypothetical protein JWQ09_1337 [Segetibacter sp.]|nr:hypothetical protein [Segetibacter sp.]